MQQRDLLQDQIEQVGKVLAKILAKIVGIDAHVNTTSIIEVANEQLNTELDIDLQKLRILKKEELKEYLLNRKLNAAHIETLSRYLIELGKFELQRNETEAKNLFGKASDLLDIADEVSRSICFERMELKTIIKNYCNNTS